MPGRAYWTPRARAYPFNYSHYLQDYKPLTSTTTTYTFKEISPPPIDRPGRLSLIDRARRSASPVDLYRSGREGSLYRSGREGSVYRSGREGSVYRSSRERSVLPRETSVYRYRASSAPPPTTSIADDIVSLKARLRASEAPDYDLKYRDTLRRFYHPYRLPIEEELKYLHPIWRWRPWSWESTWVPPHETRVWPHFGYSSSSDLILRYLRMRPRPYYYYHYYY